MPTKPEPQQNHFLAALSPEVQGRLFPYLELVPLQMRAVMYESGHAMRHVYVRDRPQLEALSCECYEAVRRETSLLLAYLPQRQLIANSNSIPTVTLPTSDPARIPGSGAQAGIA